MAGGAPEGNSNYLKNKPWRAVVDRAIAQDDGKRLRKAAEMMLDLAAQGEQWAIKELGDRLDGKAIQQVDATVTASVTAEVAERPRLTAEQWLAAHNIG